MEYVDFEYELDSGQILHCDAEITLGRPARVNCLPEDAEPAEDPVIEMGDIHLKDEDGVMVTYDPEGHWVRDIRKQLGLSHTAVFTSLLDKLEDAAWDEWEKANG